MFEGDKLNLHIGMNAMNVNLKFFEWILINGIHILIHSVMNHCYEYILALCDSHKCILSGRLFFQICYQIMPGCVIKSILEQIWIHRIECNERNLWKNR